MYGSKAITSSVDAADGSTTAGGMQECTDQMAMWWLQGLVRWWSSVAVGSVSVETMSLKLDRHHPHERLGLLHAGATNLENSSQLREPVNSSTV